MPQKQLRFVLEKETKGALRYTEVNGPMNTPVPQDRATVGTLYIRKNALSAMGVEGNDADHVLVTLAFTETP